MAPFFFKNFILELTGQSCYDISHEVVVSMFNL